MVDYIKLSKKTDKPAHILAFLGKTFLAGAMLAALVVLTSILWTLPGTGPIAAIVFLAAIVAAGLIWMKAEIDSRARKQGYVQANAEASKKLNA